MLSYISLMDSNALSYIWCCGLKNCAGRLPLIQGISRKIHSTIGFWERIACPLPDNMHVRQKDNVKYIAGHLIR